MIKLVLKEVPKPKNAFIEGLVLSEKSLLFDSNNSAIPEMK